MTQHFSHSVVATMVGEVIKAGYLVQGEIFDVRNFVNTPTAFLHMFIVSAS